MPKNSESKPLFADHTDAAEQLIEALPMEEWRQRDMVVVAVSPEGIDIAATIAHRLEAPLDWIISEPVPAPNNPQQPIARVSETQTLVIDRALVEAFGIDEDYVYTEAQRIYDETILSCVYRCREGQSLTAVADRVVLLVDESAETGATALVAIRSMLEQGAKNVYLAVPVIEETMCAHLTPACDGIYCAHRIRDYVWVDYYFGERTLPDTETIKRILLPHE